MAINTQGITTLYSSLMTVISAQLDTLYTNNKLDSETYAKLLSESIHQTMQVSVQAIQSQETIDAEVLLKGSQKLLVDQQKLTEEQNTNVVATQYYIADNSKTAEINMKTQQLAILTQQFTNLKTELSLKQQTVAKSLNLQDQQISQMEAEEAYTTQKTIVLEASRLDNKRIQAADKYQQFLSMLSANVVPSSTDIANCRILMKDIIDETDTTISATTPTVTENTESQAYNASISG